jgi:alpha-L-fucosidase
MNIGPRSDGTIPVEVQQVLHEVGAWLKVNGESIYGTRPWKTYGEGPTKVASGSFHDTDTAAYTAQDFRFTTKGNTLYAIELGKPSGKETVIRSFSSGAEGTPRVDSVTLLGVNGKLTFHQQPDGLHIELPAEIPGKYAYAFRILGSAAGQ